MDLVWLLLALLFLLPQPPPQKHTHFPSGFVKGVYTELGPAESTVPQLETLGQTSMGQVPGCSVDSRLQKTPALLLLPKLPTKPQTQAHQARDPSSTAVTPLLLAKECKDATLCAFKQSCSQERESQLRYWGEEKTEPHLGNGSLGVVEGKVVMDSPMRALMPKSTAGLTFL